MQTREHDHLRRQRRRRRARRSARRASSCSTRRLKGRSTTFVSIDGTGRPRDERRRRQPSLSRHVQGTGRPQLRRVRPAPTRSARWAARSRRSRRSRSPQQPKTTFNVGRVGGGTSVNSIPFEGVDGSRHAIVGSGVACRGRRELPEGGRCGGRRRERSAGASRAMITVVKELVGDRPAGSTPENSRDRQSRPRRRRRRSGSTRTWAKDRPTRTCP